jgi:hypothetical protein
VTAARKADAVTDPNAIRTARRCGANPPPRSRGIHGENPGESSVIASHSAAGFRRENPLQSGKSEAQQLLAMQKVVGSSPIIRSKAPANRGFS